MNEHTVFLLHAHHIFDDHSSTPLPYCFFFVIFSPLLLYLSNRTDFSDSQSDILRTGRHGIPARCTTKNYIFTISVNYFVLNRFYNKCLQLRIFTLARRFNHHTCIICVFCACLPVWFSQWHTLCACRQSPASVLLANEKYLMNLDMFNEESAWDGHRHTQVHKYTMIISIIRNEQFIFSPFSNEHWADVFQSNWQEKETNAFFAFSFSSSSFNFISFMANALCLLFPEKCFIAGYTIGHCLFFIYCIRLT